MRLRSDQSLTSAISRMWPGAAPFVVPMGTSPVMTAISASRSIPQAASPNGASSRAPNKSSEPPW